MWLKYSIGWFWLTEQTVCIEDFQSQIGENTKFYQFLIQRNAQSGFSADDYLEVGKSTVGVVYFEQADSWGGCFPTAVNGKVRIKLKIEDAFGRWHSATFVIPKLKFAEARKFNPAFGMTLSALHGEEEPFELELDDHGNLTPTSGKLSAGLEQNAGLPEQH